MFKSFGKQTLSLVVICAYSFAGELDLPPPIPPPPQWHSPYNTSDVVVPPKLRLPTTRWETREPYFGDVAIVSFDFNDRHNHFGARKGQLRGLCEGTCPVFEVNPENILEVGPTKTAKDEFLQTVRKAVRRLETAPSPRLVILIDSHGSEKGFCHNKLGILEYEALWQEALSLFEGSNLEKNGIIDIFVNSCNSRRSGSVLRKMLVSDTGKHSPPGSQEKYRLKINIYSAAEKDAYASDFWNLLGQLGTANSKKAKRDGAREKIHISPNDGPILAAFEPERDRHNAEIKNEHEVWSSYQASPSGDKFSPETYESVLFDHSLYGSDMELFRRMAYWFEITTRSPDEQSQGKRRSMITKLEFSIVYADEEPKRKIIGEFVLQLMTRDEEKKAWLERVLAAPNGALDIRYRLISSIPREEWTSQMKEFARESLPFQPERIQKLLQPLLSK